jgi:hypothetical protein
MQVHGDTRYISSLSDRSLSNNRCLCRGYCDTLFTVFQLGPNCSTGTSLEIIYNLREFAFVIVCAEVFLWVVPFAHLFSTAILWSL